tara:strand:+ start:1505 stop:2080 length:576 start_codon:yes stop_codon:yes gene_type:complete
MSRLSNVQNTYLAGNSLLALTLVEIDIFGGSTVRYTDGPFDITYGGNTYEAQGNFMGISETSEVSELQITNISLTINGLDVSNVQTFCKSSQINQLVTIRRVFLDPNDYSLIGDSAGDEAIVLFKGKIAGYKTVNATDTATITLDVNSLFTNFNRLTGRRTNQSSLQQEFPNDFGFQYSHESIRDIKWGKV